MVRRGSWTDFGEADRLVNSAISSGLSNLGDDVKRRAVILAPKDSGDLRASSKVDMVSNGETVNVSFNTAYARRRHYENRLHPSTRLYLTQALKSVTDLSKYFKRFK